MSMHRPILGELVDQPSHKPTAKLTAVGGTGIATGLLLLLAARAGLTLPEPVAEALVLAGAWLGGYVKRDKAVAAVVTRVEHALTPLAPLLPAAEALAATALAGPATPAEPVNVPVARAAAVAGEPEAVRGPQT